MTRQSGAGPKKKKQRMDQTPAFHYLAEDDEGEQASGGLSHLVPRTAAEAQWT